MLRLLVVAAVLLACVPAAAQARGLTVTVPRTITAERAFPVTWQGETGPIGEIRGGFVVRAFLARGRAACPADAMRGLRTRQPTTLAAQNVFIDGPFRGAARVRVPRPGVHRLCGYVTRASDRIEYERFVSRVVTVRPRRTGRPTEVPRMRPGVYTARATRIAGGAPDSTLRVVVSGTRITSVSATGLRLSTCVGLTPADPQLNTLVSVASTGPLGARSTTFRGSTFAVSLRGGAPDGRVSLHGGARSDREIRGVVVGTTPDGNCSGAFAFTATR